MNYVATYSPASVPVIRLSFAIRCAIALAIGAASAAGVGSILGFIVGSL